MSTTKHRTPREVLWRKSTFSGSGTGSECVEVAEVDGDIVIRDSKNPDAGHLRFARTEMRAFVAGAKAGEFDDLTARHDAR